LKAHPAAELFPMLTSLDMANLAKSIREDGQKLPIIVHDGMILDGRNRFRACQINGVEPWVQEWDGKGSPVEYVVACNLHRRHLDESQRGMVAARIAEELSKEAKERQRTGKRPPGLVLGQGQRAPKSATRAGGLLNVSTSTVENGKRVLKHGTPELVAAVEAGEVSVTAAASVATLPPEQQMEAVSKPRRPSVNKGIDPLTNPRELPRSRWRELVAARKYHCLGNIPADCRTLLRIVSDAEDSDWLGYGSRERYMRDGLELDPSAVDLAIGFLRAAGLDVPSGVSGASDPREQRSPQSFTGEIRRLKAQQKKALAILESLMSETKDKNTMQVSLLALRDLVRKAIEELGDE